MASILYTQKIVPFLWFENNAEEAARFYTSVFKNSKIISVTPMLTEFKLGGMRVMALNGGPHFKLSEAFSLYIHCDTQAEIDELWETLSAGGAKSRCGWVKDKFGLSWQIVPAILGELMRNSDPAVSQRVMQAILRMDKLDIATLITAAEQI